MSSTFIILCSVIGVTSGVGVLPDSDDAAVESTQWFTTSLDPTETPFESIKWSFEGTNIITHNATANVTNPQYKDRILLFISTGSMWLWDLALSDAGNYSVTIVPAGGAAAQTGTITLNIYYPLTEVNVTATSTDLVEVNDTVTLSCSASGPALSFRWYNGSFEFKPSDRAHFSDGGATVTINPVLRYDENSYRCRVTNPVSSWSDYVWIYVSYGPDFAIMQSTGDQFLNGSVANMSCETNSSPLAQYSWFCNEKKLLTSDDPSEFVQVNQSGNYSCEAFNSKTLRRLRSKPVAITVWDRITDPSLTASNKPVEGSALNLTCDASGPIVSREWTLDHVDIKPSGNIQFFDEKRVLSFKNVTTEDTGTYRCDISNPVSNKSAYYTIILTPNDDSTLSPALIAGITVLSITAVVGLAVGGFCLYKKKSGA